MLAPGQRLDPSFVVKVFHQGVIRETAFAELLTRPTLVSIHMRNQTGSCDRQVAGLRSVAAQLERAGWNVVALSRDTTGSHARYAAAQDLGFPLVSDPADGFARAADAIVEKSMYGRKFLGPLRSAWALDRDGTVLGVVAKVEPARFGAQLLGLLEDVKARASDKPWN